MAEEQAAARTVRFEVELAPEERAEVDLAIGRRSPGAKKAWLLAAAREQAEVGGLLRDIAGVTSVLDALRGALSDVAASIVALSDELRRNPRAEDAAFRANVLLEAVERMLSDQDLGLAESRDQVRGVVLRLVAVWAALERPEPRQ